MNNILYNDFIWGDKFKTVPSGTYLKIDDAFKYVSNASIKISNVVSHNGDCPIDEKYLSLINKFNFWFGQNVVIHHPKFIPIPIGLENDYVHNSVEKKHILLDYMNKQIEVKKLLYINHNIGTNRAERIIPYNLYKTNDYITVNSCDGFDNQHSYYRSMKEHDFILSPPGNGMDCHRTWEALYLGVIPILKDIGTLKILYMDLPVIFIDNYEELTSEFLVNKRNELKNKQFNYDKMKFSYWKSLIENIK